MLCKLADTSSYEPYPRSHYAGFFERGARGLNDYFIHASIESINLDPSEVFGWRTITESTAAFLSSHPNRTDKIQTAIAAHGLDASRYASVIVVFNTNLGDRGAVNGNVLVDEGSFSNAFVAHELCHAFGLGHSFDTSDRRLEAWSAPGEQCDPYDLMSFPNVSLATGGTYGPHGPLLSTAALDHLGWLSRFRVWRIPEGSSYDLEIVLSSLSRENRIGNEIHCIQAGGFYFEFRTPSGFDAGLSRPCVLVHTMVGNTAVLRRRDESTLNAELLEGQVFRYPTDANEFPWAGGVVLEVKRITNELGGIARVRITQTLPRRLPGGGHFPLTAAGAVIMSPGVPRDGGGWVIINGKLVRVPPRTPVEGLVERVAIASQAYEIFDAKKRAEIVVPIMKELSDLASKAAEKALNEQAGGQ